jgi:dienelactone hydrolase
MELTIPLGQLRVEVTLTLPPDALGLVISVHSTGTNRHTPRHRYAAKLLNESGFGTALVDLLTPSEEIIDAETGQLRFQVGLLADRLARCTDWLTHDSQTAHLNAGYLGSGTGAAAALIAAAERPAIVRAVVCRAGRVDLATLALPYVQAPTLLIVPGTDIPLAGLSRDAITHLRAIHSLELIPNATQIFDQPDALEEAMRMSSSWFRAYLHSAHATAPPAA